MGWFAAFPEIEFLQLNIVAFSQQKQTNWVFYDIIFN